MILVNYAYKRPYIVNIEENIWVHNLSVSEYNKDYITFNC